MAAFLPQPKQYRNSHRKRKSKSLKIKQQRKYHENNKDNDEMKLDINAIYRENNNDNLCKKHALSTIISTVVTERKLLKLSNDERKSQNKDSNPRIKRKWKSVNPLSLKKYNKFCDEFDRKNKFDIGISQKYFLIAENGKNIISYILRKFNIKSDYIAFNHKNGSIHQLLEIIEHKSVTKLIAFNYEHAWCYICIENVWYEIDSLKKRSKPKVIMAFPYNCGYIYIYD